MKIVITGMMGSGKTTLAKKILKKNIFFFRKPLIYISADNIASQIIKNKITNNKNWLRYQLFYGIQKKRYWQYITNTIHPLLTKAIHTIISRHQKGTFIVDIALPHLLPADTYKYICLAPKAVYSNIYSLKKYRKISFHQSLVLLKLQKK